MSLQLPWKPITYICCTCASHLISASSDSKYTVVTQSNLFIYRFPAARDVHIIYIPLAGSRQPLCAFPRVTGCTSILWRANTYSSAPSATFHCARVPVEICYVSGEYTCTTGNQHQYYKISGVWCNGCDSGSMGSRARCNVRLMGFMFT